MSDDISISEKLAFQREILDLQASQQGFNSEERRRWAIEYATRCASSCGGSVADIERWSTRFVNFATTGKFDGEVA